MSYRCSETLLCPSLTLLETFLALQAKSGLKKNRHPGLIWDGSGSSSNNRESFAMFGNPSSLSQLSLLAVQLSLLDVQLSLLVVQLSLLAVQLSLLAVQLSLLAVQLALLAVQLSLLALQLSLLALQLSVPTCISSVSAHCSKCSLL